jgi:hypothetical protein
MLSEVPKDWKLVPKIITKPAKDDTDPLRGVKLFAWLANTFNYVPIAYRHNNSVACTRLIAHC